MRAFVPKLKRAQLGYLGIGNRRVLGQARIPDPSLWAQLNDSGGGVANTTLTRGVGAISVTRAGATAYTRNSSGAWIGPIAANTLRSCYSPAGVYMGALIEEQRTNHFRNSAAPATQTSGALALGAYTLWMEGTGSIAVAANTATITGAGTATAGSPVTFTVTVAGTVNYTVTGSPTIAQSENGASATSYIATAGASVTRNADIPLIPSAGNVSGVAGTCAAIVSCSSFANAPRMLTVSDALERPILFANGGTVIALFDGTNIVNGPSVGAINVPTRYASRWSGSAMQAAANGVNGTADVFDGNMDVGPNICVGFSAPSGLPINGTIRGLRIWQTDLGASALPSL
jgi:hypothetical protein